MRIVFLFETTGLWGGVKNALEAANRLHDRGHTVTVIAKSPPPDWLELRCPFAHAADLSPPHIPPADAIIGTFWTTIPNALAAQQAGNGRAIHYCQGYEGDNPENELHREQIEQIYRLDVPKVTISPHLAELLRDRFGCEVVEVPYAVDHAAMYPAAQLAENRPVRVGLVGPYEIPWKDLKTGIAACALAHQAGLELTLVRVCNTRRYADEEHLPFPVEWHERVKPADMGEIYRGLDAFLGTSSGPEEGFFLPAVEAMACGVPCVLTDIPCFRGYGEEQYALFVPPGDPGQMAEAMVVATRVPTTRAQLREQAIQTASHFRFEPHVDALERALADLASAHQRADDGAAASPTSSALEAASLRSVSRGLAHALRAAADAYLAATDYDGAVRHLEAANQVDPHDPEVMQQLAHAYYLAGSDDDALGVYEELLGRGLESAPLHASRALIQFSKGAIRAAAEAFERAVELGDRSTDTLNNLGVALFRCGDPERARECFEHVLAQDPTHSEATHNLEALAAPTGTP